MKINREDGKTDEIDFSFRYVLSSGEKAQSVLRKIRQKSFLYEYFEPKRGPNHVITIDLELSFDANFIFEINKELELAKEECGFWFSINSDFDSGGFSVPDWIVEYMNIIGGKVDFSFIAGSLD
jgi:hypothetical protein